MTRSHRTTRRRRAERGQMLVMFALMAPILVGATAFGINVSAQSTGHRTLQNWTDVSALAGVRECDTACNATTEVTSALQMVLQNSPWSATSTWKSSAPTGACTSTTCTITNYAGPTGYTNYHVSVSSPPANATNAAYNTTNYVEVDISESSSSVFGAFIGAGTLTWSGHSIAYNAGPPGVYQYTMFSKGSVTSGNQVETVVGDAYVGGGYVPTGAKSGLCILEVAETAGADTDGDAGPSQDNDLDDRGHVTYNVHPPTVGPNPTYGNSYTLATCPGSGALSLNQPAPQASAPTHCPLNSTPQSYVSGGTVWICYAPTPALPNIPAPTTTRASLCTGAGSTATLNHASSPGVYPVGPGCTVTLDFASGNINCVSMVLSAGSSVQVSNKKSQQYISAYGSNPTSAGDPTSAAEITALGSTPPATACGGSNIWNDRSVIWAPDTAVTPMPTVLSNYWAGCCSDTLFIGSLFVPDQQVIFSNGQQIEDVGQIYCGNWNVTGGNHPNPIATYDPAATSYLLPSDRVVE